jgi:general secretion pathway protein F
VQDIRAPSAADARTLGMRKGVVVKVKRQFNIVAGNSLSQSDRFIFLTRLASMIKSRVGVSEALRLMETSFSGNIKRVAADLFRQIENGVSLADAITQDRRAFPEIVSSVIRTGSQGGDLAASLTKAADMERDLKQIKKQGSKGLWSAFLGFIAGVVTLIASVYYVAPMVMESDLLAAVGDDIDIGIVLTMAEIMTYFAIVGGLLALSFLLLGLARPFMPELIDLFIAKLPYYRDLISARRNFTSFYSLSVLVASGIRIEEALMLAEKSAPRGAVKQDFAAALAAVRTGRAWPEPMRTLHPTDRASLVMAQDRTQIAETTGVIADQYRNLYQHRIETLVPVLQLIAAVFLAMSGFVLFGVVFMPLLQSMEGLLTGAL